MSAQTDRSFDLICVGGGPGGCSGAMAAAAAGRTVALVEKERRVGGAGMNTGTLPSKALRESALVISGWRARKLLGVDLSVRGETTVAELAYHAGHVRDSIRTQMEEHLKSRDVTTIRGTARFVEPHVIEVVNGDEPPRRVWGEFILVATGSAPARPPEFPFEHPRIHDSNEILEITELPGKLAVIGAGVIGAEYAGTFAALGVEVHVVDGRDQLLSFLDRDVSATITAAMERAGVVFHWGERVTGCTPTASGIVLQLASGGTLEVTDVLVAAGRQSNTSELGLDAAGIETAKRGLIPVNAHFQTVVPHIYAAGDATGPPALASTTMEQARIAVCHMFSVLEKVSAPLLPTGIYTIPEASMVGETEQAVKESGVPYLVGRAFYSQNPRGRLIGDDDGFLKLIFRRDDLRLIGVHVVGEHATEVVHIGLIAMLCGAGLELFNQICFNYPTLGDLYKNAAYDALIDTFPGVRKIGDPTAEPDFF